MNRAFTLVEIMIVVIVLAILAMVVCPLLSSASDDSREKTLLADLAAVQRQISRYRFEHGNRGPHMKPDGSADAAGANLIARMTDKTDSSGALNAAGTCGPYLREWPANPFLGSATAARKVTIGPAPAARDDSSGWWFDTATQTIRPNSASGALAEFPAP